MDNFFYNQAIIAIIGDFLSIIFHTLFIFKDLREFRPKTRRFHGGRHVGSRLEGVLRCLLAEIALP